MKNTFYAISFIFLLFNVSCKKNTEGKTNIVVENKETSISEKTERYVAEDGSSTLVSFINKNGEKSISISSNKMTIKAPMSDEEGIYEDYNYKISAKNDSVIIVQGDNVIQLKKAGGN